MLKWKLLVWFFIFFSQAPVELHRCGSVNAVCGAALSECSIHPCYCPCLFILCKFWLFWLDLVITAANSKCVARISEVLELLSQGGIGMVKDRRSPERQICCLESKCVMVQAQKHLSKQGMEKLLGHFRVLILYPASKGILCLLVGVRWVFPPFPELCFGSFIYPSLVQPATALFTFGI